MLPATLSASAMQVLAVGHCRLEIDIKMSGGSPGGSEDGPGRLIGCQVRPASCVRAAMDVLPEMALPLSKDCGVSSQPVM